MIAVFDSDATRAHPLSITINQYRHLAYGYLTKTCPDSGSRTVHSLRGRARVEQYLERPANRAVVDEARDALQLRNRPPSHSSSSARRSEFPAVISQNCARDTSRRPPNHGIVPSVRNTGSHAL